MILFEESGESEVKAVDEAKSSGRPAAPQKKRISVSKPASRIRKALRILGPGLITGAADDDPSGIATCSSVGAQFGYAMLWTMPFIYPLYGGHSGD